MLTCASYPTTYTRSSTPPPPQPCSTYCPPNYTPVSKAAYCTTTATTVPVNQRQKKTFHCASVSLNKANYTANDSDYETLCADHLARPAIAATSGEFTSSCMNAVNQGVVYPACDEKLDKTQDNGAPDATSYRYNFCSKALETKGVLPEGCRNNLNIYQKQTMLTNICNSSIKQMRSPECRKFCKDNIHLCAGNIRVHCKDAATIVSDEFCQDVLSSPKAWGKFDEIVPIACASNAKDLELCNCLNPDKLDKFRDQFMDNQKPLIKAECLMPECISGAKKVYLSGSQQVTKCPTVCHQDNLLNVKDSRVSNLNLVQDCFGDAVQSSAANFPVHCQVEDWGAWSACDTACGVGIRQRTRKVFVPPSNGGSECPSLEEAQVCVGNTGCPPPALPPIMVYGLVALVLVVILILIFLK
jgi:hypothetical protein